MATYLAPAALGLGDLVVTLPVVQQLIAAGNNVHLIVRLREHLVLAERIEGLTGAIMEWEMSDALLGPDDVYINLRDHDLQRDYWWGSRAFEEAYPGYKINDILRTISGDKGLTIDFERLLPLSFKKCDLPRTVAFVPGSAVSFKCWPQSNWLALGQHLQGLGYDVIVLGQPSKSAAVAQLIESGIKHWPTTTIADALDVLSSCDGVVSVDTGLMHLAVNQGVPTVGIYRNCPVYVRWQPDFRAVVSQTPCAEICHSAESSSSHNHVMEAGQNFTPKDWGCQAPAGSGCMESVGWAAVRDSLLQVLKLPVGSN